jgi:ribosomal protein L16/L10AE
MGKGKGAVEYCVVKPGRIMFEVEEYLSVAKEALQLKSFQ